MKIFKMKILLNINLNYNLDQNINIQKNYYILQCLVKYDQIEKYLNYKLS